VIYVIVTCVVCLYDAIVCLHFFIFGPLYRDDCFTCFTVLHYSYELMHFQSCKLANLLNQKSCSYADNGNRSVLPCQFIMKVSKCV